MTSSDRKWRIIGTDSESLSGVAPICDKPREHADWANRSDASTYAAAVDGPDVWDCCPGPHIECWSERSANQVLIALNAAGAEVCS